MFMCVVEIICKMYSPAFLHLTELVSLRCKLRILSVVLNIAETNVATTQDCCEKSLISFLEESP